MLLAACGGNGDSGASATKAERPQPSSSPSASSPIPSARPTVAPTRSVVTYHDLTVELRRPATVGAAGEPAVGQFLELSRDFGQMASGDKPPASLADVAAPAVIKYLDAVLQAQRANRERAGGTIVMRITKAQTQSAVAVVDACLDQRKLVTIRTNGTRYVDATVKRSPTLAVRATVTGTTGKWRITEFALNEAKC